MRIVSGTVDQMIFFVAVDVTDLKTRETGLSSFTVYRARDTGAATAWTTPTTAALSDANMPGVYSLLLDEDTTLAAGNDSEEMVLHITHASMSPVTRVIEIYRPKITAGNTLDVTATGAAGIDWNNIENPTTAQNLSGTNIDVDQVVASVSGAVGSVTGLTNATIADAVLDEDMTAHQTQGSLGQAIGDPVADTNTIYKAVVTDATGATVGVDVVAVQASVDIIDNFVDDLESRLGTPSNFGSGATISANLVDIESQTDDIGAAGAGLTALATQASVDIIDNFVDDLESRLGVPSNLGSGATISANLVDIEGQTDDIGVAGAGLTALATQASVDTIDNLVDDLESRIGVPSDLGGGATVAANLADIEAQTDDIGAAGAGLTVLATQASVNTIDDFLDTEIAAIKAKTDSLTFTNANVVDANITHVISDAVQTSGSSTTNWGGVP